MFGSESTWAKLKKMLKNKNHPETGPMKAFHDMAAVSVGILKHGWPVLDKFLASLQPSPDKSIHTMVVEQHPSVIIQGVGKWRTLSESDLWAVHMMYVQTDKGYGEAWKLFKGLPSDGRSVNPNADTIRTFLKYCIDGHVIPQFSSLATHVQSYAKAKVGPLTFGPKKSRSVACWFLAKPDHLHDDLDKERIWFGRIRDIFVQRSLVEQQDRVIFKASGSTLQGATQLCGASPNVSCAAL